MAGAAWHAGALAALADVGWDARDAALMVGTSAGSTTASVLRFGLPPSDLYAATVGEPMSDVGDEYAARAGPAAPMPTPVVGGRVPTPAAPGAAVRMLAAPWRVRPVALLAAVLPEGRASTSFLGDRIRRAHPEPWPSEPTWICAVRLRDGRRVVFGRDLDDAHLATAVEASSAVPGFFAPVEHDGERYVDGGAHSPTNADLAAGLGVDAVVVSSPMSGTAAALRRPRWAGSRPLHRATLAAEVRRLRADGVPVLVLQPDAAVVDAVGPNSMDPSRRVEIARAARRSVERHLGTGAVDDRLAALGC